MLKDSLREQLARNCTDKELRQWFDPLELKLQEDEKRLLVQFPHAFFGQWFCANAQNRFEEQLRELIGPGYVVQYQNGSNAFFRSHANGSGEEVTKSIDYPFGSQFTFESFFTNYRNYFPLASAREVAKRNKPAYNPLIICGDHGAGKTHLMKAIANEIAKDYPVDSMFVGIVDDVHSLYAETFKGDVFSARRHFFKYDFFFLDDFQDIEKFPTLQAELVVLFNHFYENQRQMIFTCAGQVTSYAFLHPKLKSRLEWGLNINIKEPDLDIRIKYLQHQCSIRNLALSREHILILANRFPDFRYLQGMLTKIAAFKELMHKDILDEDFERILLNTEEDKSKSLEPEAVLEFVAEHFDLNVQALTGSKRHQQVVLARQVAMFLCRELLGCSYPALGKIFGGKDHSTAMHAVRKIQQLMGDNEDFNKEVTELKKGCVNLTRG